MKARLRAVVGFVAVGLVAVIRMQSTPTRSQNRCLSNDDDLKLPAGFCAKVFANGVGAARHITVSDRGVVYVVLQIQRRDSVPGAIVALEDVDGDGRADKETRFGETYGFDLRWRKSSLFVSTEKEVLRYDLDASETVPSEPPKAIVSGFEVFEIREHRAKPFSFDKSDGLYVHVGPPSNSCQEMNRKVGSPGRSPCPYLEQSAGVWKYSATGTSQVHPRGGGRVVTGLRHTLGMAWNAASDSLFLVQQGRDDLHRLWPDKYSSTQNASTPSEELLEVTPRRQANFGWPYCYYDARVAMRLLAPEYGGDGRAEGNCGTYDRPSLVFPAHTSPADILFYQGNLFPRQYRDGAFVAFLGGWGRQPSPQSGYYVAFVPFNEGRPLGTWAVFADGFIRAPVVNKPVDATYRPVGLAQDPDGALYIADARKGRIWKILYGPH